MHLKTVQHVYIVSLRDILSSNAVELRYLQRITILLFFFFFYFKLTECFRTELLLLYKMSFYISAELYKIVVLYFYCRY